MTAKELQMMDNLNLRELAYEVCIHAEDCIANDSRYTQDCCCDFELNTEAIYHHFETVFKAGQDKMRKAIAQWLCDNTAPGQGWTKRGEVIDYIVDFPLEAK